MGIIRDSLIGVHQESDHLKRSLLGAGLKRILQEDGMKTNHLEGDLKRSHREEERKEDPHPQEGGMTNMP